RLCLGLAALRLVVTFGRFQRFALILALRFGVFFFRRRESLYRAAGFLHGDDCRFRGTPDRKFNFALKLAFAEKLHSPFLAAHQPCLQQTGAIAGALAIDKAAVVPSLILAKIIFLELARDRGVAEPPLRQARMQRLLAAFKALDACAGPRGLPLAAATAGLTH